MLINHCSDAMHCVATIYNKGCHQAEKNYRNVVCPFRPKVLKNLKGVKLGQKPAVMLCNEFFPLRKKSSIENPKSQIIFTFVLLNFIHDEETIISNDWLGHRCCMLCTGIGSSCNQRRKERHRNCRKHQFDFEFYKQAVGIFADTHNRKRRNLLQDCHRRLYHKQPDWLSAVASNGKDD